MAVAKCPRAFCHTVLVEQRDRLGRIDLVCKPCHRNRRGRCRDCPGLLPSYHAMRCRPCAAIQARKRNAEVSRRRRRDPKTYSIILLQKRQSSRRPAVAARRHTYQAKYRAANPRERDELDRLYHREWMRRHRADPAWNARINKKRRKRYRQRRRDELRAARSISRGRPAPMERAA